MCLHSPPAGSGEGHTGGADDAPTPLRPPARGRLGGEQGPAPDPRASPSGTGRVGSPPGPRRDSAQLCPPARLGGQGAPPRPLLRGLRPLHPPGGCTCASSGAAGAEALELRGLPQVPGRRLRPGLRPPARPARWGGAMPQGAGDGVPVGAGAEPCGGTSFLTESGRRAGAAPRGAGDEVPARGPGRSPLIPIESGGRVGNGWGGVPPRSGRRPESAGAGAEPRPWVRAELRGGVPSFTGSGGWVGDAPVPGCRGAEAPGSAVGPTRPLARPSGP